MKNNYIIDFDSTFTQVEALDELARISLANNPNRQKYLNEIENLTNAAMDGKLSFRDSLSSRVQLLQANKGHLDILIKHLKKKVSASFSRNREFFKKHADDVLIVSGGFKEFICPVVENYHIQIENVYANTFIFDDNGEIIGYDLHNPLSEEGGKVKLLKSLQLEGRVFGIGDGYSDFQLKESGLIEKFFAFTENIERESVASKADYITPNFDEFLYINKLPRAISYPKNRIVCLVTEDISPKSVSFLKRDGFTVKTIRNLDDPLLKEAGMLLLQDESIFGAESIEKTPSLKVIGYLGNSKNKVDRDLCSKKGIAIFDDKKNKTQSTEFIPKRMADFINNGDTHMSRNFPNLKLPKKSDTAHRLIHIHKNTPGVMAHINLIFARNNINIISQFLMTKGELGYAITDIRTDYTDKLIKELKEIENTIKFRLIY